MSNSMGAHRPYVFGLEIALGCTTQAVFSTGNFSFVVIVVVVVVVVVAETTKWSSSPGKSASHRYASSFMTCIMNAKPPTKRA
ncbi:hypothetical protein CVT25_015099 [Psilocybe cyanescens]|uniref:Uncharacterized protein n=1 Tax=Psilocybe cyanescens TaxID=93625 RepID=A0A409WS45_PSICY|nr:hypothetical protein CVT25_015099 [Psilocybe cyanescens]